MRNYPLDKIHKLIEPGPIVLVTTAQQGRSNIMTMGFHMMIQHAPPLIGAVIGPWDFSYKALKVTRECVIAVPGIDLAEKVVDIGNCSGGKGGLFISMRKVIMVCPTARASGKLFWGTRTMLFVNPGLKLNNERNLFSHDKYPVA